ncbi:MAG: SRPBCC family protein [Actinomycetia bacterium]|nr:SRPBCC family protein [Actinomycetes bacterium]
MELINKFTVPTSLEQTWASFQDIVGIAQCVPGTQVTSVTGDSFEGTIKVKLGPISMMFVGGGEYLEKDESAHRLVVTGRGRDKRGAGTAAATLTVTMAAAPDGGTAAQVNTDLAITGKPAQLGKGVIQDVADSLLAQFTAAMAERSAAQTDGGDQLSQPGVSVTAAPASEDNALDLGTTVIPVLVKGYGKQAAAGLAGLLFLIFVVRRMRRHHC